MAKKKSEYRVRWEIDLDADSPEEAAKKARTIQLDPKSWANQFDVFIDGEHHYIDLLHPEDNTKL